MKRVVLVCVILGVFAGTLFAGGGGQQQGATFTPSRSVDFHVSSGPGGGSDIYSRVISDIIAREGFTTVPITVINNTDGAGNINRVQVSNATGVVANHSFLAMNAGDVVTMIRPTPLRVENFRAIAILAADKHLLYGPPNHRYTTFPQIVDAINRGERLTAGAARMGDDEVVYDRLMAQMGWNSDNLAFVGYTSSAEAITAVLGGHIDFTFSKPAATDPFVVAGQIIPIVAFATERFGGNLASAPILSELGYNNVEFPLFRGILAPPTMTDEAVEYWGNVLRRVIETPAWKENYIQRFLATEMAVFGRDADEVYARHQAVMLRELGLD